MIDPLLSRVAIILEISDRKQSTRQRLGKTAMQKLVFLLQEFLGRDLGYRFSLFTYGPCDASLMSDLDYAEAAGFLKLMFDSDSGYTILPGASASELDDERQEIRQADGQQLDELLNTFGNMTTRDLEVCATLVFIARSDPSLQSSDVLSVAAQIKPRYDRDDIERVLNNLPSLAGQGA